MIRYDMIPTNQGELLVAIDERGLVHVDFVAGLRPLLDASPGVMFVSETYVSRPDYFA